jgi:hypothetical protein
LPELSSIAFGFVRAWTPGAGAVGGMRTLFPLSRTQKTTYQTVRPGLPLLRKGGHPGQPLHCSRPIYFSKKRDDQVLLNDLRNQKRRDGVAEAEAGMLLAEAASAICVQKLDDSRNSAIHTRYRISLRSSSLREPRYPLLRVVFRLWMYWRPHGPQLLCFSCSVCGWFK